MFSKFTKKRIVIGIIVLIALILIGIKIFGGNEKGELLTVIKSPIVKEVVVTGSTKARSSVDLGFDKTGKVSHVYADVGDRVSKGSLIAELDASTDLANLAKEQASLSESVANLGNDSLKLASNVREGFRAADDAIRNKSDQFFKTPHENPSFEVKFTDGNFVHYFNVPSEIAIDLNNTRKDMENLLNDWQKELSFVNESNAQNYSAVSVQRLNKVSDFLNKIALAVNQFTPAEFQYESTVEGYKTNINSARSEVSTALQSLINVSSLSSGDAKINQSKASVNALESELQRSKIIAPFSGVVTKQDAKPGSIVSANSVVTSLISDDDMYIEADVSEVNIGKIILKDQASIKFDALPDTIYKGEVSYIEPAETIIDGVVNYKIRVELTASNTPESISQIKSGMTANLNIETARVSEALAIPNYAITERDGKKFVSKVISPKNIVETEVETGLVGSDGLVEIKSGLSEGDTIQFLPK